MSRLYPILLCGCQISKESTTFFLPLREVKVAMPADLAKLIIRFDGTKSLEAIVAALSSKWDKASLENLLKILIEKEVLMNSRTLGKFFHSFGENPNPWCELTNDQQALKYAQDTSLQQPGTPPTFEFSIEGTKWTQVLEARKSVRSFDNKTVKISSLHRILWACYGMTNRKGFAGLTARTVPSAGGLFPLAVHVTIFSANEGLPVGSYRVTSTAPDTISLQLTNSLSTAVLEAFLQQPVVRRAAGVITISGSFGRCSEKYANRGNSYVYIEAGHAAQNVHLTAVQEEVATLELGGFIEAQLREALKLDLQFTPIITIAFGNEAPNNEVELQTRDDAMSQIITRTETAPAAAKDYYPPFTMVFAELKPADVLQPWHSCGRSPDPSLARIKATAEAVEWFTCTRAKHHNLTSAQFTEIADVAIHPEQHARYLPEQLNGSRGITAFDPTALYEWLLVRNIVTGVERLVLADFVYFPYAPPHGKRFAHANSSGTAAHTTPEKATESALFELAEREAYMITWFNRIKHERIRVSSMPADIQHRIREIEKQGFSVFVTDMTMGLAPVVHISVIGTRKNPFFSSSAASTHDFLSALDRALMETEASVYCRIRDGKSNRNLSLEKVEGTEDHADLYQQAALKRKAMFLSGSGEKSLSETTLNHPVGTIEMLVERFMDQGLEVFVGELSERDSLIKLTGLHVIKAIVPGLVPMTFGFNVEPVLLDRIRQVPVKFLRRTRMTPFKRLNRLPHPFN